MSSNQDVNTVSVFLRGTGGFAPESGSPFSAPGATSNGTVADFNGDGLADLAISDFNFSSGQAVILLRQAGGGFAQQGIPIGGGNPASAVGAGDFNRDGRVDLVVAGWGSGNVSVYLQHRLRVRAPEQLRDRRRTRARSRSRTSTATARPTSPCSTTAPRTS